jgi:hypothetical protein
MFAEFADSRTHCALLLCKRWNSVVLADKESNFMIRSRSNKRKLQVTTCKTSFYNRRNFTTDGLNKVHVDFKWVLYSERRNCLVYLISLSKYVKQDGCTDRFEAFLFHAA